MTAPRSGGPNKKTTSEDDQALREVSLQNNWSDMSELRQLPELEDNERIASVCDRTLRRRLSNQGDLTRLIYELHYSIFLSLGVRHRVAAIKERLLNFHRERRLNYAQQFIDWTLIDWSRVIFIDEFSICTGDGGRIWVWRENGTRYDERNIASIQNTHRFSVSFIAW